MFRLLLFVCMSLCTTITLVWSASVEERIVGGEDVPADEDHLFQVSVQSENKEHICNGAIVNKDFVLTSAYCCEDLNKENTTIVFGAVNITNIDENTNRKKIKAINKHQNFNTSSVKNDICLLELDSSLTFQGNNKIQKVKLPEADTVLEGNVTVYGWGTKLDNPEGSSIRLQSAELTLMAEADCKNFYEGLFHESMICTKGSEKDFCTGDMGAPLVTNGANKTLVGLASWGFGCGNKEYPGVYANVKNMVEWINSQAVIAS